MNIKININGKEIDAQISEADAQKIQPSESRFVRNKGKEQYFEVDSMGNIYSPYEQKVKADDFRFSIGNYFTSEKQAQDHIRALKLWQAIKVFRQEHDGDEWKNIDFNSRRDKWFIEYDCKLGKPVASSLTFASKFTVCFFSTQWSTQAAIDEFYGELMWYFTEFQDD